MKNLLDFWTFILRNLPLGVYYFVADCFYYSTYYVFGYRRKIVRKNIAMAFPEKSEVEHSSIEKRFYRHLADYIVESAAMIRLKKEDYLKRYRFINPEIISSNMKSGKNVLLVTGHYANWEWMNSLPLLVGENTYALYQEQSNKLINEAMLKSREMFGMKLLNYPGMYREILNSKGKHVMLLLMLADQRPKMDHKAEWIDFLNQPVTYFRGLENLQRELKGVPFYTRITKIKRGHYDVEFIPMVPPDGENSPENWLTMAYFRILENNISIDPAYYLWSHNRWKFRKPVSTE